MVAHHIDIVGVVGSSPASPTIKEKEVLDLFFLFLFLRFFRQCPQNDIKSVTGLLRHFNPRNNSKCNTTINNRHIERSEISILAIVSKILRLKPQNDIIGSL